MQKDEFPTTTAVPPPIGIKNADGVALSGDAVCFDDVRDGGVVFLSIVWAIFCVYAGLVGLSGSVSFALGQSWQSRVI